MWLYEMCRGVDHEPVSSRQLAKSIGCGKNFLGKERLDTKEKVCVLALKHNVLEKNQSIAYFKHAVIGSTCT